MRLASLVLLVGCAYPTEIHVTVDADDALVSREQVLEVLAFDEAEAEIYRSEQLVGGATGIALPAGLRILPRSGADGVGLRFLLRAGPSDVRVRRDVWLAFAGGEVQTVRVLLDAACDGMECGEGFTCACPEPGCAAPDCVEVGRCESPRPCDAIREQRCDGGALALVCAPKESDE